MRNLLPALALLALPVFSSCGAEQDIRFEGSTGGYGFADAVPGQIFTFTTTAVCVEGKGPGQIEEVRFTGTDVPPVAAFSVIPSDPDRAELSVSPANGKTAVEGGSPTVTASCDTDSETFYDDASQVLAIELVMPPQIKEVKIRSVQIVHQINGTTRTSEVPLEGRICPKGFIDEVGEENCTP